MRKRVMSILFFFFISIYFLSAVEPRTAYISFTSGLVANVGFTDSPIGEDDYLKPKELSGESAVFTFESSAENYDILRAGSFYIYYQIFTPYRLKVYASVTPLNSTDGAGQSVNWRDSSGTISDDKSDSYGYLIFDDGGDINKPRADSKIVSPIIDGENLNSIDWESSYEGTITLKVVVG